METLTKLNEAIAGGRREDAVNAARQLGESAGAESVPGMLEQLRQVADPVVRDAIAVALSDIGDPRAVDVLFELLDDPRTEKHRGTLLYALQAFDLSAFLARLVELVATGGFEVSRQAFLCIEQIDGTIPDDEWDRAVLCLNTALADDTTAADNRGLLEDLKEIFDDQ